MPEPLKLAVLLSGGGRTLENFCRLIDAGQLPARISLVVASRPGAYGLERAKKHNLPAAVVDRKQFADTESFSARITAELDRVKPDLVLLAGFLSLYRIPDRYLGRVLNIHPALIPAFCGPGFYGHHVHEAVLEYGAKISGCTVHFADNEYDRGPIILQRPVPVAESDTPDTLADRVFAAENEAYPEAIRLFAAGRLKIEGRRCRVSD